MFREIQIRAVLNGWVVQVGCQTVVYEDRSRLVTDLDQYLRDPRGTEERFLKSAINTTIVGAATDPGQSEQQAARDPRGRPGHDTETAAVAYQGNARDARIGIR